MSKIHHFNEWVVYQKGLQLSPFPVLTANENNKTDPDLPDDIEIDEIQMFQEFDIFSYFILLPLSTTIKFNFPIVNYWTK